MSLVPTPQQNRALLRDCWQLTEALPGSGVLNRAGRPYRAIRFERRLADLEDDPAGLHAYTRDAAMSSA